MIISVELLKKFNPTGKVSALEFLVGMLTYGDIVDKERDIDPILRKFIELDKDKTGLLSVSDLKLLRESIHVRQTTRDSSIQIIYDDMMDILYNRHHFKNNNSESTEMSSPMHDGRSSVGSNVKVTVEGNIEEAVESL